MRSRCTKKFDKKVDFYRHSTQTRLVSVTGAGIKIDTFQQNGVMVRKNQHYQREDRLQCAPAGVLH